MKKFFAVFAAILFAAFVFAPAAEAKDLSKLKASFSADINKDCGVDSGLDPVWGCYIYDAAAPLIYINKNIPAPLLTYVFLRNVGQHLVFNVPQADLAKVFHPAAGDLTEVAASAFAIYALGGQLPQTEKDFFASRLQAP